MRLQYIYWILRGFTLVDKSEEESVLKAEVRQIKTGNQAQTTEALLLQ